MFVKTPGRLEAAVSCCVYPFVFVSRGVTSSLGLLLKERKTMHDLQKTIEALTKDKQTLEARIVELEGLKQFVQETDQMKTFKRRYDVQKAPLCQIIQRRFNNQEQVLFVDRGSRHGITTGMIAVHKNAIVGKVDHVFPYYSKVITVSDVRCKIAASCSRSQTHGIFEGTNNINSAKLAHVDRLKKLYENETITSSGEGTVFPRGFLLGIIETFTQEGMHHKVNVTPAVDIEALTYCYLIQKGQDLND